MIKNVYNKTKFFLAMFPAGGLVTMLHAGQQRLRCTVGVKIRVRAGFGLSIAALLISLSLTYNQNM